MSSESESIDFNKILLFGSWAIPSRMFGWGFLGLLSGCAAFSSLRLSGTLEYVDPYMGSWIYFLLLTYVLLGIGLLGRVGYQRGLFLVSLYAMKSPLVAPFLAERLLKTENEEAQGDYKARLIANHQAFLTSQDFEEIAAKDGPVTGYRAEVVDHVKRQVSDALLVSFATREELAKTALPLTDAQLNPILEEIEARFQMTLKKSTRRWIFILVLVYAITPALLVLTRG
ncbi:MAG: hypothetical protein P1V97_03580 [Planctomycetota bacterium]|nr:hypothetical protein [Planctomycetota bacterium]